MCLRVGKIKKRSTAKEDIVCYKAIKQYKLAKGYMTFYRDYPIELGNTYKSELILLEYQIFNAIEIGLHSFENYEDCKKFISDNTKYVYNKEYFIVKCIIPKGSKYFKGIYMDFIDNGTIPYECYASDCLKYEEII